MKIFPNTISDVTAAVDGVGQYRKKKIVFFINYVFQEESQYDLYNYFLWKRSAGVY